MDIKITDIFNIKIDPKNNNEYIVIDINSDYIDDFLISINQYNGTYIYKLNKNNRLKYEFNKIGLNIDNYIEFGNYIIYETNNIKILLVNKNCTILTNKYNLIDNINNLYIWKPISPNPDYINFGLIITSDPHDVPEDDVGLILDKYIKIFNNSAYSQLFQNDYNLIGCSKDNKKKLYTINMINSNQNLDQNRDQKLDQNIEFTGDWNVYKSKNFILNNNENPWFKNTENISMEYINNNNYFNKIYKNHLKKNKHKFNENKFNETKFDETKKEKSDKSDKYFILTIMVFLILMLLIYNFFKKRNLNMI